MTNYLKIISRSLLAAGLLIIVLMIIALWLWQGSGPIRQTTQTNLNPLVAPIPENFLPDTTTPLIGLITKMNGDTIWVSRWGNNYQVKLDPQVKIIKTTKPVPIPPNQKQKIKPASKTQVQTSYLKTGQQVSVASQLISSNNQLMLLATNLEIWE